MRHELKTEFKDTKTLLQFIKKCYSNGVLIDKNQKMAFEKESHINNMCKGLTNLTIRLWNDEIIDGTIRFIIEEYGEEVFLHPCSIIYEMENDKYSFII